VIPNETIHHVEVQIMDRDSYCRVDENQTGTAGGNNEQPCIFISAVTVPVPSLEIFDFIPTRTTDRGVNILLPEAIVTGEETNFPTSDRPVQVVTAIPILYGDMSSASS
jgi:hypothetical protein